MGGLPLEIWLHSAVRLLWQMCQILFFLPSFGTLTIPRRALLSTAFLTSLERTPSGCREAMQVHVVFFLKAWLLHRLTTGTNLGSHRRKWSPGCWFLVFWDKYQCPSASFPVVKSSYAWMCLKFLMCFLLTHKLFFHLSTVERKPVSFKYVHACRRCLMMKKRKQKTNPGIRSGL